MIKIQDLKNKICKTDINIVLVMIFAFNAIFVPADPLDLKKISLILLLVVNYKCLIKLNTKDERLVFGFGFLLTSFTILLSICLTGQVFSNIKYGYCGYILLLYLIIKAYGINFAKVTLKILTWLAYFIVIMAFLDLIGVLPLYSNNLLMWLHDSGNAMIGKGSHLATGYCIFMKASPMLFLSMTYFFMKKEYFHAFITCLALLLSGTRANMFMCLGVVWLCMLINVKQKNRILLLGITIISAGVLLLDGRVVNIVIDMFVRKAGGDAIRSATLEGIFNVWMEKPISFFTGSGFTATFYNPGREGFEYNVELSYWNLLRQVGIIPFSLMMLMYIYPVLKTIRDHKAILSIVGYCAYLVIAYTNPLLYSSTGLLTLLYMYCACFRENMEVDFKECKTSRFSKSILSKIVNITIDRRISMKNGKRKILLLSSANPTRAYSGIKYMYQELCNRGYEISIWAPVPNEQRDEYLEWGGEVNSFFFNGLGKIPKIRLIYMQLVAFVLLLKYRNEVIICHELTFYRLCVLIKTLFPNTKLIHYCTELFDENSPRRFVKLMEYYEKHSNSADLIIECDEKRRIYRKEKYSINKPTVTIYNTLPEKEIRKYVKGKRRKNEIPVITYTGAAYGHRQLDLLINAVADIDIPYVLNLYVYGPHQSIEKLDELCMNKLGLNKYKIVVDIPREKLFEKVMNSDIGIVYYNPNLSIGNKLASPTKFFEYVGMGIPVVSSNNDSLMGIIDKYNLGVYVKDTSVEALRDAICLLLEDDEARGRISDSEVKAFSEFLCYEKQTKNAFEEMEKLIMC